MRYSEKNNGYKKYKCSHCGRKFHYQINMEKHKSEHNNGNN
jgi:DNA-directed RNA polymerase subunit RPC12/RpoP